MTPHHDPWGPLILTVDEGEGLLPHLLIFGHDLLLGALQFLLDRLQFLRGFLQNLLLGDGDSVLDFYLPDQTSHLSLQLLDDTIGLPDKDTCVTVQNT